MAKQNQKSDENTTEPKRHGSAQTKSLSNWKPGSEAGSAAQIAGSGDFGVPETPTKTSLDRDYTSANTKASDRGAAQPRSSEMEGNRVAGAGAAYSGPGSASGGDVDPDVIGIGDGIGIATSGNVYEPRGPDDTDGSSDAFASGGKAKGENSPKRIPRFKGSVVSASTDDQTNTGQGADSATNPARNDDAAAGEISSGEASGDDN
jgi:hypothetical protein